MSCREFFSDESKISRKKAEAKFSIYLPAADNFYRKRDDAVGVAVDAAVNGRDEVEKLI